MKAFLISRSNQLHHKYTVFFLIVASKLLKKSQKTAASASALAEGGAHGSIIFLSAR
jgi:hypothetical protein